MTKKVNRRPSKIIVTTAPSNVRSGLQIVKALTDRQLEELIRVEEDVRDWIKENSDEPITVEVDRRNPQTEARQDSDFLRRLGEKANAQKRIEAVRRRLERE